jgi:hypothetical protein
LYNEKRLTKIPIMRVKDFEEMVVNKKLPPIIPNKAKTSEGKDRSMLFPNIFLLKDTRCSYKRTILVKM